MTWLRHYQVRHYVGNSIWILPTLSNLAALGGVRLLQRIEEVIGWQSSFDPETARLVHATMAASMFTDDVGSSGSRATGCPGSADDAPATHPPSRRSGPPLPQPTSRELTAGLPDHRASEVHLYA